MDGFVIFATVGLADVIFGYRLSVHTVPDQIGYCPLPVIKLQ